MPVFIWTKYEEGDKVVDTGSYDGVSSIQWSHQEASGVCEALLSQRIPSPSTTHIVDLSLPPFRSSASSSPTFQDPSCHCSAKESHPPTITHFCLKASSYTKVTTPLTMR